MNNFTPDHIETIIYFLEYAQHVLETNIFNDYEVSDTEENREMIATFGVENKDYANSEQAMKYIQKLDNGNLLTQNTIVCSNMIRKLKKHLRQIS